MRLNNTGSAIFSRESSTVLFLNRGGTDGTNIGFYNDESACGSISVSGASTAYNTSSDERLKENIQDAEDAGIVIDNIQVRQFDWIVDNKHQDYGMIAQELEVVYPDAVSVYDEENNYLGIDYSKLVPVLIKEIQSLRKRVSDLEEK